MNNNAKYLKIKDIIAQPFYLKWFGLKKTQYGSTLFIRGVFMEKNNLLENDEEFLIATQSEAIKDALFSINIENPIIKIYQNLKVNAIGQRYTTYAVEIIPNIK